MSFTGSDLNKVHVPIRSDTSGLSLKQLAATNQGTEQMKQIRPWSGSKELLDWSKVTGGTR